ncbi:winged helix DNA-binding domain-containing protein [Kineosporia corallincola]
MRALGRATLARQHLLARTGAPVLDTVAHLGGLQAQEPQEPFVGLWSRLERFAPAELSGLLEERRVVRMHLMRRTVHLMTAQDAHSWRPRHHALLRQKILGVYKNDLSGVDLDQLTARAQQLMDDETPRSLGDVGREMARFWPGTSPRALGEAVVAALVPMVQIPPRGVWRSTGGALYRPLDAWIGEEVQAGADQHDHDLIRRYLGAFGPASSADLRAWCGLAGLPASLATLREELVELRDERGRRLLDLPGAPLPDPETPAPVRFLPSFDNAVLGYHERSRIIDDEYRPLSVTGARFVLVDGRACATWTTGKSGGQVVVHPLRPFTRAENTEIADEAERLSTFLATA